MHSSRMRTHRLQSRGSLYSEVQFDKVGGGMASVQLGTMSGKGGVRAWGRPCAVNSHVVLGVPVW